MINRNFFSPRFRVQVFSHSRLGPSAARVNGSLVLDESQRAPGRDNVHSVIQGKIVSLIRRLLYIFLKFDPNLCQPPVDTNEIALTTKRNRERIQ